MGYTMKRKILLICLLLTISIYIAAYDYGRAWQRVNQYDSDRLPRSAKALVDSIYEQAKNEGDTIQRQKAIVYKMKYLNELEEKSFMMERDLALQEIEAAPDDIKALLHSMLGEMYWEYYQQNASAILERTELIDDESGNIETWGAQRILRKSIEHFQKSLELPEKHRAKSVDDYGGLIRYDDIYTDDRALFSNLALRALAVFQSDDSGIAYPANRFLPDERYMLPTDAFIDLKIVSEDSLSMDFHALATFQKLLRYYRETEAAKYLIPLDLDRLQFILSKNSSPAVTSRYQAILEEFLTRQTDPKFYDRYADALARFYCWQYETEPDNPEYRNNYIEAEKLCREAIENLELVRPFCQSTLDCITNPSALIFIDAVNPIEHVAPMTISYRNISRMYFRVYRYDESIKKRRKPPRSIASQYRERTPIDEWIVDVPDPGDHITRKLTTKFKPLPPGHYTVMFSLTDDIDTLFQLAEIKVSDIAWMVSGNSDHNNIDVVNRLTGQPMEGVRVEMYTGGRRNNYNLFDSVVTDENGQAPLKDGSYFLDFITDGDTLRNRNRNHYTNTPQDHNDRTTAYLFTDRSIYRPGQTVYYKGIVIDSDTITEKNLAIDFPVDVDLLDVNRKVVATNNHVSNQYGSFNGSFVLPESGITGSITLQTRYGGAYLQVEEYKRPKFEVEFDPIDEVFTLDTDIEVRGKAASFAGYDIASASVRFSVTRIDYRPWFGSWRHRPVVEQCIASGETHTAADGTFSIPFTLVSTPGQDDRAYCYMVKADVTDINDETRSGTFNVYAGNRSLIVDILIDEKVNREGKSRFELVTDNLMNVHIPVEGTFKVYRLKAPDRLFRLDNQHTGCDTAIYTYEEFVEMFPHDPYLDENDPDTWEKIETVFTGAFDTGEEQEIEMDGMSRWKQGPYRIEVEAKDPLGADVSIHKIFTLYSPKEKKMPQPKAFWAVPVKTTCEPGEKAEVLIGSSYPNARIIYTLKRGNESIKEEVIELDNEQKPIRIPIRDIDRGGITADFAMFRENRGYTEQIRIDVPLTNKKLNISWSTFRDKIEPGAKEEFRLTIEDYEGDPANAEFLACMYDASLDEFIPHMWREYIHRERYSPQQWDVDAATRPVWIEHSWPPVDLSSNGYRSSFNQTRYHLRILNWFNHPKRWRYTRGGFGGMRGYHIDAMSMSPTADEDMEVVNTLEMAPGAAMKVNAEDAGPSTTPVQLRSNFAETAFFYPELRTNKDGDITFSFTVPDALTKWKLMGFAHTEALQIGKTEKYLTTQKKLMVTPNLPRFLRESDRIVLSAKIESMVDEKLDGKARLLLFNAADMQPIDAELGNAKGEEAFSIEPNGNTSVEWEISIPDDYQAVVIRMVAQSSDFSDGEEHLLPVLPNRMLVTESLPMPIRGNQTKDFTFRKLKESGNSTTIEHHRLTLEFTTNPVWYVVQALPYMAEYPHECAEQIFTRYYANTLAEYIVQQNPKIERIFQQWRDLPDSKALLSNLEKNQDLKSILLEETPWVRQAENETERKKRIGLLFDLNHMTMQRDTNLGKLFEMQLPSGAWPWFNGMNESRYITQYIVEGFGHLKALGIDIEPEIESGLTRAMHWLDGELNDDYRYLLDQGFDLEQQHIRGRHIHYFYLRSFFPDVSIDESSLTAYNYYYRQLNTWWKDWSLQVSCMQALALYRYNDMPTARKVFASLRERAMHSEEMGMYWKENRSGYFWYNAPIETQSLLIELFREMGNAGGS